MNPSLLERISLRLPGAHPEFHECWLPLLSGLGRIENGRLDLSASDETYRPHLSIEFNSSNTCVSADFQRTGGESIPVKIENTTGATKRNPITYRPITAEEVSRRLASSGLKFVSADHIGFNLPWFGAGVHPRILELREKLAAACLYHEYPSGEPWDFILPGTPDEISGRHMLDYSKIRKPKFELVSFGASSIPLIQIDLAANARFEQFSALFPEGWADSRFRNIWIYLENPSSIDVCLVINEYAAGDWSDYFAGHRLPG
jgi:hypothetical protein